MILLYRKMVPHVFSNLFGKMIFWINIMNSFFCQAFGVNFVLNKIFFINLCIYMQISFALTRMPKRLQTYNSQMMFIHICLLQYQMTLYISFSFVHFGDYFTTMKYYEKFFLLKINRNLCLNHYIFTAHELTSIM